MKSNKRTIKIHTKASQTPRKQAGYAFGRTEKISKTKAVSKKLIKSILLSKTFQLSAKTFLFLFLLSSVSYGAYGLAGNTIAGDVVVSKSEIIKNVTRLVNLPPNSLPQAVVRVEDADSLKKQNGFYGPAKEGDYILVYDRLAVIYDLRKDTIVSIKRADALGSQ